MYVYVTPKQQIRRFYQVTLHQVSYLVSHEHDSPYLKKTTDLSRKASSLRSYNHNCDTSSAATISLLCLSFRYGNRKTYEQLIVQ